MQEILDSNTQGGDVEALVAETNNSSYSYSFKWTLWIPVVSALAIWLLGVSPIWIIIIAGIGGYGWGKLRIKN